MAYGVPARVDLATLSPMHYSLGFKLSQVTLSGGRLLARHLHGHCNDCTHSIRDTTLITI